MNEEILEKIYDEMSDFTIKTGQDPEYLYLGRVQFKEFKEMIYCLYGSLIASLIHDTSFDGMYIIKVDKEDFLRVG